MSVFKKMLLCKKSSINNTHDNDIKKKEQVEVIINGHRLLFIDHQIYIFFKLLFNYKRI